MKLEFDDDPATPFVSGSQKAKAWTERWVATHVYCPNCGNERLSQLPPNLPVADFFCARCQDQYELKSQKKPFGTKLANGAFATKQQRLSSSTNPNLVLISYDAAQLRVDDLIVVPKHFFTPAVVEERRPLAPTARRAGWVGSNILLSKIPEAGRISIIRRGEVVARDLVIKKWQQMLFLRDRKLEARGWLIEVMRCVDSLPITFTIADVYRFEGLLGTLYPHNKNVRPKIRQQLQVLRDIGYLEFAGRGHYRRVTEF
jgi:type II restriction enzyme